ncbi:16S rRNA (cytosine967-C5)-methyltransferase [Oceanospirillum multiglobuliferum]|uniref:16S rRNA (cytosine(967)-C(5))-methyltransferase n=1 Tax=Oceanospirillum multiglobuliferum TaxID=64969 RepID=A0A1T4NR27_9GAMM|nr:16S rRNA (cytosine(967)-C(5))-methyltransferase RsmB [Oceanospirillum multiglobuliferum]OPX55709.1 16S rRNA (cytosine(967)-C(5))-methyltransferase [Oceanospirillum multiglobuliferum]SJZ81556.1 16S rRNA (cytosine967-C5)-methyltransferase [Oceanospirillum multiglobuliferum]
MSNPNVRVAAVKALLPVVNQQESLSGTLPDQLDQVADQDRGLLQELCFGTLRWLTRLEGLRNQLITKPFKSKDRDIDLLLLVGLYQLIYTRIPAHAAINETVQGAVTLKKDWAKGVLNGCLRRYQRESEPLTEHLNRSDAARLAHPNWLLQQLQQDWPEQWQAVAEANNQHPPMTLRINRSQQNRDQYLAALKAQGIEAKASVYADDAILLDKACDVTQLAGFTKGHVSVQDEAAQLAADLLQLEAGMRVLDACAAPGGKTAHMLERESSLSVVAVDSEANRLKRVEENFQRLQLSAELHCSDITDLDNWWDGQLFDRILLDAPCSATGVIRRHPDIKWLRRKADIPALAALQQKMLQLLWKTLKPNGIMVYATCSVLSLENKRNIETFLAESNAQLIGPKQVPWGIDTGYGQQLLPQTQGHDGFFYAVLQKPAA